MNIDITWCTGVRCTRANTCERWIEHLKRWCEQTGNNPRMVSMAEFSDHDGKCRMYDAKEEKGSEQ